LYQGIVPKLLWLDVDELTLMQQAGFLASTAPVMTQVLGWCEVVFGVGMLIWFRPRWHFLLTSS
jgi:hypothetical protein